MLFIHSLFCASVDERREERESLWRVVESIARARRGGCFLLLLEEEEEDSGPRASSLVEEDASWSLDDDDDDDFDASIEPSFLCSDYDVA